MKISFIPKKTKFIIIIIAVAIVGLVGWLIFRGEGELPYDFVVVQRGDIVEEVSTTGTVKPAENINLRFETGGTVERVYVSEGAEVAQGSSLVKLYTGKLYNQFLQTKASYNQANAELNQFIAGVTVEEIQVAERVVENARIALEDVRAKADSDLTGDYNDARNTFNNAYFNADKAMNKLEALFDKNTLYKEYRSDFSFSNLQLKNETKDQKSDADSALEDLQELITTMRSSPSNDEIDDTFNPFLSHLETIRGALDSAADLLSYILFNVNYGQTQWDTDKDNIETGRTTINTAITNVLSAQQAVVSQKVTNQVNINSAENTLRKAEDDLTKLKAVPREVDIAVYRAKVEKARASMLELQQSLDDAVLKAPIEGVITNVNVKVGETVVAGGDPAVSLINTSEFQIKVDIPEADIGKIDPGDPAEISLDAFPETSWPGQIAEVNPAETLIEGVVYYRATVIFDEIDERIKSGMSADVTVETDKKENVLSVPYRAIIYKEGKKIIRILEGEEIKEIEAETGLRGARGEIEIISGIREGDKVITLIKND